MRAAEGLPPFFARASAFIDSGAQYSIGNQALMRAIDAEPIRAAIAEARGDSAAETARLHRLERLRADLLADEGVLHGIAERHPGADLQHLRTLRRATLKEQEQQKPPRNYRALFQALKSLETDAADAASGDESTPDTGAA